MHSMHRVLRLLLTFFTSHIRTLRIDLNDFIRQERYERRHVGHYFDVRSCVGA
jgi:hypothetical protein